MANSCQIQMVHKDERIVISSAKALRFTAAARASAAIRMQPM
jgi:hypothetical protein